MGLTIGLIGLVMLIPGTVLLTLCFSDPLESSTWGVLAGSVFVALGLAAILGAVTYSGVTRPTYSVYVNGKNYSASEMTLSGSAITFENTDGSQISFDLIDSGSYTINKVK